MKKSPLYCKLLVLFALLTVVGELDAQSPCTASFSYSLNPLGIVSFSCTTPNTNGGNYYFWTCNQTSFYSSAANPTTNFSTNGSYVINLTVGNSALTCTSTVSQTVNVTNAPCLLNANFSWVQNTNGTVSFYNNTTGAASGVTYLWNFGDNTTSTAPTPAHTFTAYGTYLVTLTGNNNYSPSCVSTKTMLVNYNRCVGGASFSYTVNPAGNVVFSGNTPLAAPSNTYRWAFGNGSTYSVVGTPAATTSYSVNGNYLPSLLVSTPSCSASITGSVNITNTATPCNLVADFSYNQSFNNANIIFNNSTVGSVPGCSWSWNFGDNTNSTGVAPVHTYSAYGSYLVTLTVNNNFALPGCISTKTLMVTYNTCSGATNNITYSVGANGIVTFTSTSSLAGPSTVYSWTFGNNNTYSVIGVPTASVAYSFNGNYYPKLILSTSTCSSSATQSVSITNTSVPCTLNTYFSYYSSVSGGATVSFYINNVGTVPGTTYLWNFGDNSISTLMSPSHTYSANGVYTVTFTANNNTSITCVYTQTAVVVVGCNLVSGFSITQGNNGQVNFSNTSTGTTSNTIYSWNFGDGIGGNGPSPSHTYANGTYTVTLSVANSLAAPICFSIYSQVINVTSNCVANAAFSVSPSGTPLYWNAIPASPGNVTAASWSWGDGSTSSTLFTSHTYSAAGTYSICLSVTVACGASDTVCTSNAIFRSDVASQNLDMVYINVIDPATVGIRTEANNSSIFSVSPNPNNGSFNLNINGHSGDLIISIYDINGKVIFKELVKENKSVAKKDISLDGVTEGIYFVKANLGGSVFGTKIIIEK